MSVEAINQTMQDAANIQMLAALQFQGSTSTLSPLLMGLGTQTKILVYSFAVLGRQISVMATTLTSELGTVMMTLGRSNSNIYKFGNALDQVGTTLTANLAPIQDKFKELSDFTSMIGGAGIGGGTSAIDQPKKGMSFTDILSEGMGGMFQRGIGKAFAPKRMLGSLGGMMGGGMAALGPQMLALSLVMKPISALLAGLLEPLEPIIDLFGMVGDMLGLLLVPIVMSLMGILLPFMPLLLSIINVLLPVINWLLIPLNLLGILFGAIIPLITGLMNWIGNLMGVLTTIAAFITGFFAGIGSVVGNFFTNIWTGLADAWRNLIQAFTDWWNGIWSSIVEFGSDLVDDLKFWKRD